MSISACQPRSDSGTAAEQRLPLRGDFSTGGYEGGESEVSTTNFTNGHEFSAFSIVDATGTTEGRYRYTAFGGAANTVTNTTFAATQPYRFSTKYLDKEVETAEGTYFYGFRHFVPVIGRWPSRDPIGERGRLNLYGMVGNDATDISDFLGLNENSCPWNCFDKCNDQVDECPKVNCYVGAFIELGNECRRYKSRNCHSPTGRPRGLSGGGRSIAGWGRWRRLSRPVGFCGILR